MNVENVICRDGMNFTSLMEGLRIDSAGCGDYASIVIVLFFHPHNNRLFMESTDEQFYSNERILVHPDFETRKQITHEHSNREN